MDTDWVEIANDRWIRRSSVAFIKRADANSLKLYFSGLDEDYVVAYFTKVEDCNKALSELMISR